MNFFDFLFKKPSKPVKNQSKTEILDGITINYRKNAFSKNIRITPKQNAVLVTLPKSASYKLAKEFVLKNLEWVKKNSLKQTSNKEIIEKRRALAKKILPERLKGLAEKFGFKYGKVFVKNHKTIWGSCSYKNNINLNLNLVALDDDCIDYVLLHELTHTVHKNHQKEFYDLLTCNMPNALEIQKKLKKIKISSL